MRVDEWSVKSRRCLKVAFVVALLAGTLATDPGLDVGSAGAAASDPASGGGSFVLAATSTGSTYAPTFTGNGTLGIRVPPAGQGYAGGTVPTQSELAGFYAQQPGGVQQRATIPTWSTLAFSEQGQTFALTSGHTGGWRQQINFRTGVITTTADWTAPDGRVTGLAYQVLTDRARSQVGLVRLQLTPRWSGSATVTDTIDGTPAAMSTQTGKGWSASTNTDWVSVQAQGTNIDATIASRLTTSGNVTATATQVDQAVDQSVGQQLAFRVTSGHSYIFTKYVGVATSQDSGDPARAAQQQARGAAASGFGTLLAANDSAWAALWSDRIDVLGNAALATDVNASEFYLWSSVRDGVDWSISPAGLSSNGYNGHIFWDAETWMYPALLAQHPDLAAGMDAYRYQRLTAAQQHAAATGYQGARFPWEGALDGTEQIPPASVFTEGLYEQHVTADIALAQWQYYLATGDKKWLARRGWPVISQAAAFWASRVSPGPDGIYHISEVTGPDEENPDVSDEAYTMAAAKTTLQIATTAANTLGVTAPAEWSQQAAAITVPLDPTLGIHPEFTGYGGGLVKQADVTLLQYPLGYAMAPDVAANDLNYYVPRTDPNGPSMSESVNSIDTSALGTPGCASFVYTLRSGQPFIRDVFDQFSETRSGGAFTFMTGIGGFLQEFLYGYSGLRWGATSVSLAPSLTGQLGGVVLHGLSWHGRRFTVEIDQTTTSITLNSGTTLPVTTASGIRNVTRGRVLTIPTRRPDLSPTTDAVRCGNATATSSQPGAPALAAVDGSTATGWRPVSLPATLTVRLPHGTRSVSAATLVWGQQWPPAPAPDQPPPPGPVALLRATGYQIAVSTDGHSWHTVAQVDGQSTGVTDVLHFPLTQARYVSLRVTASAGAGTPMLDELSVS